MSCGLYKLLLECRAIGGIGYGEDLAAPRPMEGGTSGKDVCSDGDTDT